MQVDSTSYTPTGKPSACTPYGGIGGTTDYTQAYPANLNQLAYTNGTLAQTQIDGVGTPFQHQSLTNAPTGLCPTNAPLKPDWPPAPPSSIPIIFSIGLPPAVTVSLSPGVNSIQVVNAPPFPLTQHDLYAVGDGFIM